MEALMMSMSCGAATSLHWSVERARSDLGAQKLRGHRGRRIRVEEGLVVLWWTWACRMRGREHVQKYLPLKVGLGKECETPIGVWRRVLDCATESINRMQGLLQHRSR